ncbi:MAG: hypothetical protein JXA18_16030 [Chitinispirillaceae bacterium]|nr:hypothetical protein [Chitinispirillaceae bacterium]
MKRRRDERSPVRAGVTLLDLTVAIVLTAIVVSIVYAAWTQINRHTLTHQRRTALRGECSRVAEALSRRLRRAEEVLAWDRTSIRFILSGLHDTVTYSYNGETLEVNGRPLAFIAAGTSVNAFSIENQNVDDVSLPFLFRITVALATRQGETDTVSATVMVRRPGDLPPDDDFIW